jgi:cell division transport system ATP-binding protein
MPQPSRIEQTPMVELMYATLRHREDNLALKDVCFRVDRKEFVFIVGPTGSGKSSLLRLMNGEMKPTSGEVWVDGEDVARMSGSAIPFLRRKIGVVFQDFRLLPERTLEENVAFALRVIGMHGKEVKRRTWEALDGVGLAHKGKMYPNQVSGGEQQRAAVARAIVNRPMLLLADEPTGNLDPETSLGIMELLEQINKSGTTVLVATHDHHNVDVMCKRVVGLREGEVVRDEAYGRYVPEQQQRHSFISGPTHVPLTATSAVR